MDEFLEQKIKEYGYTSSVENYSMQASFRTYNTLVNIFCIYEEVYNHVMFRPPLHANDPGGIMYQGIARRTLVGKKEEKDADAKEEI